MKFIKIVCWVVFSCGSIFAANCPVEKQMTDQATLTLSVAQQPLTSMSNAVNSVHAALTPDWNYIDQEIVNWFDSKKLDTNIKWDPLRNMSNAAFNQLIQKIKQRARADVGILITAWDTAANAGKAGFDAGITALWAALPKGRISGAYSYCEGARDSGEPGWASGQDVVFLNLVAPAVSFSLGLQEIEVKISADIDALIAGASAEIATKVSGSFTVSGSVNMKKTSPFAISPVGKPTAATGFQSDIEWTLEIASNVSVGLTSSASFKTAAPVVISLGAPTGNIVAGKFN